MTDTLRPWYSSVEAQRAFLTLPEDDQRTLELKHRIEANAMNVIHRAKEVRTNLQSEKSHDEYHKQLFMDGWNRLESISFVHERDLSRKRSKKQSSKWKIYFSGANRFTRTTFSVNKKNIARRWYSLHRATRITQECRNLMNLRKETKGFK